MITFGWVLWSIYTFILGIAALLLVIALIEAVADIFKDRRPLRGRFESVRDFLTGCIGLAIVLSLHILTYVFLTLYVFGV
jgi:hypothetical protein